MGAGVGMLAGWRGTVSAALAESTPNLDGDFGSLQPGQFIWDPERAPAGPAAIIVSIPKQLVFIYRNDILIGVSTCSTGKPGHSTPAGVFTILDKAKVHTSATYGEPMPDMEKLTWKGIALHVGDLPGYPDSMAAFTCRQTSPTTSTPSPKSGRRSSSPEGTLIPRR